MRPSQATLFEKAKNLPRQTINVAAFRGESKLLSILSVMLALAIAGYLYFVGLSIMNVIVSREASMRSESLQTSVASLEQQYFELSKTVSADTAADMGLGKPVETTFARGDTYLASNVSGGL